MNFLLPPKPKVLCYKLKVVDGEQRWYLYKGVTRKFVWVTFNTYENFGRRALKAIYGIYDLDCFDGVIDDIHDLRLYNKVKNLRFDKNTYLYAASEEAAKQMFADAEVKHKHWAERNGFDFTTTIEGNVYTFKATEKNRDYRSIHL